MLTGSCFVVTFQYVDGSKARVRRHEDTLTFSHFPTHEEVVAALESEGAEFLMKRWAIAALKTHAFPAPGKVGGVHVSIPSFSVQGWPDLTCSLHVKQISLFVNGTVERAQLAEHHLRELGTAFGELVAGHTLATPERLGQQFNQAFEKPEVQAAYDFLGPGILRPEAQLKLGGGWRKVMADA